MKAIFAVVAVDNVNRVGDKIAQLYPSDHLMLASGQWLIADEGTAQTVSEKIGLNGPSPETPSSALVLAVSGYFGRQVPNVWEWIKAKWGSA